MNPAQYYRSNKTWAEWLGRTGTVVVSTLVRVSAPEQSAFTPYSYAVVDFGDMRHEFMGAGDEVFAPGDEVLCVLKKMAEKDKKGLIEYGIKITKNV